MPPKPRLHSCVKSTMLNNTTTINILIFIIIFLSTNIIIIIIMNHYQSLIITRSLGLNNSCGKIWPHGFRSTHVDSSVVSLGKQ